MATPVPEYRAEPVEGMTLRCLHGEGPSVDPRTGEVTLVDMKNALVHVVRVDGVSGDVVRTVLVGERTAALVRPHAAGGHVVVADDGVFRMSPDATGPADLERLATLDLGDDLRPNEGGVDPAGRLYIGTMAWEERAGAGTLWGLAPGGEPVPVIRGTSISNGLAWTGPTTAYYADTSTGRVDVLQFEDAPADRVPAVTDRRPLLDLDAEEGHPDGLTVDDEGCAWVAMWGGSQVLRISPGGDLLARVRVPVVHTTACWFGGPDRDVLYITTSPGHRDPAEAEPDAGRLFQARIPGVTGAVADQFG